MKQSIVIYLSMMIFLVMSSHYVYKTPRYISVKYAANHLFRTNMLHPFIFLSCFVFAAIFGARYNVGIDQLNYLDMVHEPGFEGYEILTEKNIHSWKVYRRFHYLL